jgi:hypothetical protein
VRPFKHDRKATASDDHSNGTELLKSVEPHLRETELADKRNSLKPSTTLTATGVKVKRKVNDIGLVAIE